MISLALLGVVMLGVDLFADPSRQQIDFMDRIDLIIAAVFLTEFTIRLVASPNKKSYFRHHWWLLLSAIPLPGPLGDTLRAFRLIGLVRLLRVVDHLEYEKRG